MQASGQEAGVSRKRAAETDVETQRQEAEHYELEGNSAQKRKAEEEPSLDSLAEWWINDEDPEDEVDVLLLQLRDRYLASVHQTGSERPVCEEPKVPFAYDDCGWDYVDDMSGKLLNNTLVEKARAEEIAVIKELGVWEVVDRPHDEVVYGTRWVDINKGDEDNPYYRSRLVVQEYKRKAEWAFFTATPPLEALRSLLICATIEELPNEVGQPVAWTETVVVMLIDVRRAHFYSVARRKVHVELPAEACTDKTKVGRLLRSMYGCRDAGVNWEFTICQVMTKLGFV